MPVKILFPALLGSALLLACAAQAQDAAKVAPTAISAEQGSCSALLTVTDAANKPLYNAKISTRIRSGLLGARKLDLEAYTSAAGQVKVTGLPAYPKKTIYFYVSSGDKLEIVEFKPDVACHATYDVKLK
jgi:hypothetical protein